MAVTLGALPYYGGKSPASSNRLGPWIARLLGPPADDEIYCETHGGMFGVLLSREKAPLEIACDIDPRVMTWWRVLQDRPRKLSHIIETTPHSTAEFRSAVAVVVAPDRHDDLDIAKAVTVLLAQGMVNSLEKPLFSKWKNPGTGGWRCFHGDRLVAVYERIKDVVLLDATPAAHTLQWTASLRRSVVYCDPPYTGMADTSPYVTTDDPVGELAAILREHQGRVAVSGYGDTWDSLGWVRTERTARAHSATLHGDAPGRREVVWSNFEPWDGDDQPSLFD